MSCVLMRVLPMEPSNLGSILVLLFTPWVTLDKLVKLSLFQLPHLSNECHGNDHLLDL